MKIIKVNQISLVERDIIEIDDYKDFEIVHRDMFTSNSIVYALNDMLYMLSPDVAFLHRRKNGIKTGIGKNNTSSQS